MPKNLIRIGAGNVKQQRGPVRQLTRKACDSIGLNEAWRLAAGGQLAFPSYRTLTAGEPADRRAEGTPMLVSRDRRDLGELAFQIADPSRPDRIAPERWARVALYGHPEATEAGLRGVAHVNIHLHYIGLAYDKPDNHRVEQYDESARRLRRLLHYLKGEGFGRVLTGDVNIPEDRPSPGWLTAWEAGTQAGLTMKPVGNLDAFGYDADRFELHQLHVIPRERFGSDHPGTVAELRGRKR